MAQCEPYSPEACLKVSSLRLPFINLLSCFDSPSWDTNSRPGEAERRKSKATLGNILRRAVHAASRFVSTWIRTVTRDTKQPRSLLTRRATTNRFFLNKKCCLHIKSSQI